MKQRFFQLLITILLLAALTPTSVAAIRLPAIIGSHMVLKQKSTVNIWGWSNPAEKTRIMTDWDSTIYEAVADSGGRWTAPMKTPSAGGPYKIILNAANAIVLEDVMIGEVWVCSGQSNMEWSGDQGLPQSLEEAPQANNKSIRLFYIPKTTADYPQDNCAGSWKVCRPEEMIHFSAVGYFFGKELQQKLNTPIGLIGSNWGGTPAEVWTPRELVEANSELQRAAAKLQPYDWWPKEPGKCYNAMIHPITRYSISGAIWYQGESNTGTASTYQRLFTDMIGSWRKAWRNEFPFYFVQIAPYTYGNSHIGALLREAQTKSVGYPNTGMVVVSDLVDDVANIHPNNKRDVAKRLANWALAETYGRNGIPYKSPAYKRMVVENDKIRIHFDYAENGLTTRNGKATEFLIAGEDQHFVPASAEIEENTVVVSSPAVEHPVAVRFGFSNTAIPNLFSTEGLPVNLFRTDNWHVKTDPINR